MKKRNEDADVVLFRIDRKTGQLLLGALAVVCGGLALAQQQLTITTSYPVPSGIYNQLVTTGNSGTVPADTTLNRNAGNTLLVPATNPAGMVGVGMTPASKLSVAGGVQLGDDVSACTAAKAGTLRWESATLQACNGTAWGAISSVASGTWGGSCDPNIGGPTFPATACAFNSRGSAHYYYISACAAGWRLAGHTDPNPGSVTYTSNQECIKN